MDMPSGSGTKNIVRRARVKPYRVLKKIVGLLNDVDRHRTMKLAAQVLAEWKRLARQVLDGTRSTQCGAIRGKSLGQAARRVTTLFSVKSRLERGIAMCWAR